MTNPLHLAIAPLAEEHARDIVGWRYEGEYARYSFGDDAEETVAWALNAVNRVHAVVGADGALVAYCSYGVDGQAPGREYDDSALDVGVGLRPELTGQGLGRAVIEAVLALAEEAFGESPFRVTVAAFNTRTLTVYGRAGFEEVEEFETPEGRLFTVLVRNSSSPS